MFTLQIRHPPHNINSQANQVPVWGSQDEGATKEGNDPEMFK